MEQAYPLMLLRGVNNIVLFDAGEGNNYTASSVGLGE